MKTPDEIKNGLEHCRNDAPCLECEYADQRDRRYTCEDALLSDALAYIQQLEMLAKPNEQVRWERDVAIDQLKQLGIGFGEKIEAQVPKWISADNPPQKEGEYIVIVQTADGKKERIWDIFHPYRGWCGDRGDEKIVYWMSFDSLPEPPKEG